MTWLRSAYAASHGIDEDALVSVLVPDATEKPDYFTLVGLIGKAPAKDTWRVYVNWRLTEYYEIPEQTIEYLTTTPDDRTRVWVRTGDLIRHVIEDSERADEVRFLSGPIAQRVDWASVDERPGDGWGPEPTGCTKCKTQYSH